MKVILISNLKNLGKLGDVINVKDGYARNYLIPEGFAIYFSDANYEVFKGEKATIEKENAKKKELAAVNQKKILAKEIVILENAGDDGKLYGSISSVRLAKLANELLGSNEIKRANVILDEVIKNVGKYKVTFELHPEVSFKKEIIIARTKEEAEKIRSGAWDKEIQEKLEAERKEMEIEVVTREDIKEEVKTEATEVKTEEVKEETK